MDGGLSLTATDFELFGLPARFAIDQPALDAKWKTLQSAAHPDRFATETAAAQRVAMQWAIRINEAYRRLKAPLARAAYLCALNGADVQAESNTAMPAAFLMQQMEWREALSDATSVDEVEALSDEVVAGRDAEIPAGAGRRRRGGRLARRRRHRPRPDVRRPLPRRRGPPDRHAVLIRQEENEDNPTWLCSRSPNPARRRTRTSAASPSASTSAPRTRWWPRCATASPNACPMTRGG